MRRAFLTALAAILTLVSPLWAARDFSANTSNYMKRGDDTIGQTLLGGATALSIHAWVNLDALPTGGAFWYVMNVPMGTNQTAIGLFLHDVAGTTRVNAGGRSRAADSYQGRDSTGTVSTSTWTSIGGVANFTGDTVTPYLNGVADNGGAVTFSQNTYLHTAVSDADFSDSIGVLINASGTATSGTQVDGRIAEVAIWGGDIGAAGFAQLKLGIRATQVSPGLLRFYMPLETTSLTDEDAGHAYTITGSIPMAAHVAPLFRHPGAH